MQRDNNQRRDNNKEKKHEDELLDEALEESFPGSDVPSVPHRHDGEPHKREDKDKAPQGQA